MKAVILAGGEGTRLRPITEDIPKPLVPIGGKPCMSHILELLKKNGIDEAVVTLCYLGEKIKEYYGESSLGVKLKYFTEKEPLGTAGSVKSVISELGERFLVICGDALCETDITEAEKSHKDRGAELTMILKEVEDTSGYGVVSFSKEGRVERFIEKPQGKSFSNFVNTGMYIVEKKVFDLVPEGRKFDFSKDLFPEMLRRGSGLYAHVSKDYWCDIGSIKAFYTGNFHVSDTKNVCGKGCSIAKDADVRASVIFDNVDVGSGAVIDSSIICSNVKIDEGIVLPKGSVVRSGAHITKMCKLQSLKNDSLIF